MLTMCHYKREQKKKERSEPLIAVLKEVLKIKAYLKAINGVAQFEWQVTR